MIRLLLPLAVFLSASAALAVEIVIVRLGAPYVGQSLLPWSAAIVAVLLGLSAGHVLGGVAGGVAAGVAVLRAWLAAAWLAAGLVTMALPLLAGVVAGALADEHGFGAGAVVALAALACPPSLAAGFVAPLALRIAAALPRLQLPRAIGAIYAASALGSVIGTAASGFILLESIGAAGLASAAGGL
ncbi:MAG: fused MFS/spermidine synthase, partial [Xanthobacteraceae bacterium]